MTDTPSEETLKDLIELADQAMADVNAESSSDVYDRREVLAAARGLLDKMSASAGDAESPYTIQRLKDVLSCMEWLIKMAGPWSDADMMAGGHCEDVAASIRDYLDSRAVHAAESTPSAPHAEAQKEHDDE